MAVSWAAYARLRRRLRGRHRRRERGEAALEASRCRKSASENISSSVRRRLPEAAMKLVREIEMAKSEK
jgi:hypothetical protein